MTSKDIWSLLLSKNSKAYIAALNCDQRSLVSTVHKVTTITPLIPVLMCIGMNYKECPLTYAQCILAYLNINYPNSLKQVYNDIHKLFLNDIRDVLELYFLCVFTYPFPKQLF